MCLKNGLYPGIPNNLMLHIIIFGGNGLDPGVTMDPFLYCTIQFVPLTLLVVLSRKENRQDGLLPLAMCFVIRLLDLQTNTSMNLRKPDGATWWGPKCYTTTF